MTFSECLLFLLSTILVVTIFIAPSKPLSHNALAIPPSFPRQEVLGNIENWFDMYNNRPVTNGPNYTDIKSVNYFSNGKSLNATIWLDDFKPIPPAEHENVNYGMYFDADFNKKTGVQGIDYKVEISWDNKSQTWTRVFEEWGTNTTKPKTLSKEPAKNFFENGSSYVTLSADLNTMVSPDKYKAVFYAEVIDRARRNTWIVDATNWISIPPSEFTLSVLPGSLDLRQGDKSTIEVKINSTTNSGMTLELSSQEISGIKNAQRDFDLQFELGELHLSPYGIAASPLHINAFPYGDVGPHTIVISANSTIPVESIYSKTEAEHKSDGTDHISSQLPPYVTDETKVKQSPFLIEVDKWDLNDQFNAFIDQWFTPLAAVYTSISGIISGILGYKYGKKKCD